jgi:hypothetical protein
MLGHPLELTNSLAYSVARAYELISHASETASKSGLTHSIFILLVMLETSFLFSQFLLYGSAKATTASPTGFGGKPDLSGTFPPKPLTMYSFPFTT